MMPFPGLANRRSPVATPSLAAAIVIALLVGCTTQQTPDQNANGAEPRVMRQVVLPLLSANGQGGARVFSDSSVRGTLASSGDWRVRGEITHPRLRCGTYRMGLQFGRGDGACNAPTWRTQTTLLPARVQCNNATLVHSGEGSVDLAPEALRALDCVRVVVQCTGTCG